MNRAIRLSFLVLILSAAWGQTAKPAKTDEENLEYCDTGIRGVKSPRDEENRKEKPDRSTTPRQMLVAALKKRFLGKTIRESPRHKPFVVRGIDVFSGEEHTEVWFGPKNLDKLNVKDKLIDISLDDDLPEIVE